jgi:hypothetical protein
MRFEQESVFRIQGRPAKTGPIFWCIVFAVTVGVPLFACQVPVFRYALERWQADSYQIVVMHDGELSEEQKLALSKLKSASLSSPNQPAMIDLRIVDTSDPAPGTDPRLLKWWKTHAPERAQILAFYPPANSVPRQAPLHQMALNETNVSRMFESPVRTKLVKQLEKGASAVWIFVPCGREADDNAARQILENQIAADAAWLELPSAEELEVRPEILKQTKIPLKIDFSIVTLDREAPEEQFLLQSLLNSEEDLTSFDQPLAFPVFGQGRVLYCLVGKGIAEDTVRAASSFMAGPCSCQVKNQNPGFDLLLQADWDASIGDVLISEPIETPSGEALEPKLLTIPPGRKSG